MNAIIIDDHPLAIAAIRNLLIKNDIEILAELTEGGSAVQRVETLKPDIVIIDVDIPGVNGIQVLETLSLRLLKLQKMATAISPSLSTGLLEV